MNEIGLIIAAVPIVFAFGLFAIAVYKILKGGSKEKTEESLLDENSYADIRNERQLYGFYDPEVAESSGYSHYNTISGQQVRVTAVTDDPESMRRRQWPKGMRYYGPVEGFLGTVVHHEVLDVLDIALYAYFFTDLFDTLYPLGDYNNDYSIDPNVVEYTIEHQALDAALDELVEEEALSEVATEQPGLEAIEDASSAESEPLSDEPTYKVLVEHPSIESDYNASPSEADEMPRSSFGSSASSSSSGDAYGSSFDSGIGNGID